MGCWVDDTMLACNTNFCSQLKANNRQRNGSNLEEHVGRDTCKSRCLCIISPKHYLAVNRTKKLCSPAFEAENEEVKMAVNMKINMS